MCNNSTFEELHGVLICEAQHFADATLKLASAGALSALKSQVAGLVALVAALDG